MIGYSESPEILASLPSRLIGKRTGEIYNRGLSVLHELQLNIECHFYCDFSLVLMTKKAFRSPQLCQLDILVICFPSTLESMLFSGMDLDGMDLGGMHLDGKHFGGMHLLLFVPWPSFLLNYSRISETMSI